jgi:hypothetical protein
MTLAWQRENAPQINQLAKEGDKLAIRLIEAYRALYAKKFDPYLQSEWMKICDDYFRRDLTIATRRILQDRFGYKIPKDLKRVDS